MKILKFGGSSVADADRISRVAALICEARGDGPVVAVVSALGGTTDALVDLADRKRDNGGSSESVIDRLLERHLEVAARLEPDGTALRRRLGGVVDELRRLVTGVEYIGDCPAAVRDRILAAGERLSAPLVASAVSAAGHAATAVDGTELIVTDRRHGSAAVDLGATRRRVRSRLPAAVGSPIPVVTGFIGATADGRTTTLGRGGSDLTATVLGAALDARRVEIWTDVNGIFTAPPRIVAGARPQPHVSYDEAAELARFGAAVLFSKTVAPVRERSIPVVVRNTFDPDGPSTLVDAGPEVPSGARSLASVEWSAMFRVRDSEPGRAAAAAAEVAPGCLIVALAAASDVWTLVTDAADADRVERRLRAAHLDVRRDDDVSLVAVVGTRLLQQPWVAGRALEALGRREVPLRGVVSPSEHSICAVVSRCDHRRALTILHDALMLPHLAGRAADAARRSTRSTGGPDDTTSTLRRGDRRDRNGRPAARPPAA